MTYVTNISDMPQRKCLQSTRAPWKSLPSEHRVLNPWVRQIALQGIWCKPCDTEAQLSERIFSFLPKRNQIYKNEKWWNHFWWCLGGTRSSRKLMCKLPLSDRQSQAQPVLCPKPVRDRRSPGSGVGTGRLGLSSPEACRGKALRASNTNLRPNAKIWFKWE